MQLAKTWQTLPPAAAAGCLVSFYFTYSRRMTTFLACSMTRARLLQEWHDAANRIGSNFRVFAARKARAMQEVALDASMEAGPGPETTIDQQRVRKRDVIFQAAGSGPRRPT